MLNGRPMVASLSLTHSASAAINPGIGSLTFTVSASTHFTILIQGCAPLPLTSNCLATRCLLLGSPPLVLRTCRLPFAWRGGADMIGAPNKSLDASGTSGLVIDNLFVTWLSPAASTQPFGGSRPNNIESLVVTEIAVESRA